MIPSICPEVAPPGEKQLFRRLRDDPDTEGWYVLHGLDLAQHTTQMSGEADFVVIVPEYGILVIEVKSHTRIHVDDQGWHLGDQPHPEQRGPFKQAAEAMHSLRKYVVKVDPSYGSFLTWSAACFPRLTFRQKSPEWHDWQIIDRGRLTSAPISTIIKSILLKGRDILIGNNVGCATNQPKYASIERCERITRSLRPIFEVAISPKARRNKLEDDLIHLTEEQYSALDQMMFNPRMIFSGAAGTGKTVLATEALRRTSVEAPQTRLALFCFNKLLGQELHSQCKEIAQHAVVTNIDEWLYSIAKNKLTPAIRNSPDFFKGKLVELAIECLLESDDTLPCFDFIILDEAQDLLQPHYLELLDLILDGGLSSGQWLFFGDFLGQDIFSQGSVSINDFRVNNAPSAAMFGLSANCRNTLPISEYVVSLGQLKPPYAKVLRGDTQEDPELKFWSDGEMQKQQVTTFISECMKAGYRAGDIVLLSPIDEDCLGMQLALDAEWSQKVAPYGMAKNRISYTTIQKFKGMEAPVIILTDFNSIDSSHQQSLFYIGLSRALHCLGIFLHEDLKPVLRSII
ncbi:NERD domain-containing protein [Oceaniferula spumae]